MNRLITLFAAVMMAATSFAADYIELQMGEVFTIANNGKDVWTIVPVSNGTMKIVGDNGDGDWIGSCLNVFDDEAMTNQVQNYNWTCYEVQVKKGRTYYIKNTNTTGISYKGHCTMAEKFAFSGASPAVDSPFHIVGDCEAQLYFTSANVTFKKGELKCNGATVNIYNFTDFNDLVSQGIFTYSEEGTSGMVNYNGAVLGHQDNNGITIPFITQTGYEQINVLYQLLSEGTIATGQDMTLTMHGVKNSLTGELLNNTGELTVHWTVGDMPTTMTDAKVPETLNSWYNYGDPSAIASFTFSKDIKSAQASLMMGNAEANDFYIEELPVSINGNTVSIDLAGVRRTYTTMGLSTAWGTYELHLSNVTDIDGNGTYSGGQGMASSYVYNLAYKDISTTLSYEITPASGHTLTDADTEVEIWLSDNTIVQYDAVEWTYYTTTDDGVDVHTIRYEVGGNELKIETSGNEATITCPIPSEARTAANVCVSLNITSSVDGMEHPVVAYYNTTVSHEWEIAHMADPVSGSTVHRLSDIFFTLNSTYAINNSAGMVHATVHNAQGELITNATFLCDGMTNARLQLDEPITEAGTYTISIAAGAIGDYIYGHSQYFSGTCNPATTLTYTVSGRWAGKSMVTDPDEGEVPCLDRITLISFEYNAIAPSWNVEAMPYVEDASGARISASYVELQDELDHVTIVLDRLIHAVGSYTLFIPSGSICNAATGDPIQAEYTFAYTIATDRINTITPPDGTTPLYNLQGQRLTHPTPNTPLILNHRKVIINK